MATARRDFYHSLEFCRFLAALLVMLFHVTPVAQKVYGDYPFADIFRAGHFGVEYFFVLSGFLMYSIHADAVGRSGAALEFFRRRAIRIFPTYWMVFGGLLAGLLLFPSLQDGHDLSAAKILRDVLLLSWNEDMILGVSWTLKRELIFYGLFAFCLAFPRLQLYPLWGWQLAIILMNVVYPETTSDARGDEFFGLINLGFGAGMLIAAAARRGALLDGRFKAQWSWVALAGLGLLICAWLEWSWDEGGSHDVMPLGAMASPVIYTALAMAMTAALVGLERQGRLDLSRLPAILGGSSYALYLIHAPFLSLSMRAFKQLGVTDPAVAATICCLGAIAASMLFYAVVERTALRWLNAATAPRPRAEPQTGPRLASSDH